MEPEPLSEEDLIVQEAIEVVITESLDIEGNPANGETFMEAREAVIKEQNPKLHLDEPEPEKPLKEIIPQWCHEYLDVFTEKEAIDLLPHQPWDHHVNLTPDTPPSISCRTYPLSQAEEEYQTKYIQEQLDASLIQELKSPYTTPIFYIKKKNRSFCPIFNYQKINVITVKDTFPLPHIDTIIKGAQNKVKFSVLDLCNSYWNVQNSEASEDILAFKTTRGLYSPLVMPFGPTNAPAYMQHFMNHIFAPLCNKYPSYFENYMDDCSIIIEEGKDDLHCQIIIEFLQILQENHLFLQPAKCLFEKDKINFLGMRLNCHGMTIDPGKLAGLRNWPHTLGNVKEVRKVLRVLRYQCLFIPNFAGFTQPLTNLLKKDTVFEWTPDCHQALDTLIDIVTLSPVLIAPNQDCQFELEVDASQFAIGVILWQ